MTLWKRNRGQVVINQPSLDDMETLLEIEPVGDLTLKGFQRPVSVLNILGVKSARQAHNA